MKKYILNIIIALVSVFTLGSCEDFLTQVNPNQISTDSFWQDLDDCEIGMVAVYNQLRLQNLLQFTAEELRSDLGYPGYGRPSPDNASRVYYFQTHTSGDDAPNRKWAGLYTGIFRANQVIVGLDGIKDNMVTEDDLTRWNYLMAEARFFRGLFHFWAHSSFNKGKVIMYDFVPDKEEDFYQKLQPEKVVREFFRQDLLYAYNHMDYIKPEYYVSLNHKARVTKGAAAMALAQSYMYQPNGADYDSAKIYLEDIIEKGTYALAGPDENQTTNGEFNSESILEISYDRTLKTEEGDYSPPTSTYSNYAQVVSPVGGWRAHLPSCWLILALRTETFDNTDPRNLVLDNDGFKKPRTYSLRASNTLALCDDSDQLYYGEEWPSNTAAGFNNLETAYFKKLTNWDICTHEDADLTSRSGVNYRLMRLADVYLLYAECLIMGTDVQVDKALTYVNRVRYRSALQLLGNTASSEYPTSSIDGKKYDASSLMEHLMYVERPLELCLEGYATRQIDLRRWGITKERFLYLSTLSYHGENFEHPDDKGVTKTVWGGILVEGPNPDDPAKTLIDFTQAAQNYIGEYHDYWPIPTNETTANPEVQ